MRETMKKIGMLAGSAALAGVMALPGAQRAEAATILSYEDGLQNSTQQSAQNPCFIGNSCGQNGGLPYTQLQGQVIYPQISPLYDVGTIRGIAGDEFEIGIDVNTAHQDPPGSATEILSSFEVLINGIVVYEFNPANPVQIILGAQGNGYADAKLGTISIAGLLTTDTIQFRTNVTDTSDGFETFFIIAGNDVPTDPGSIPEPMSLALFGLGLAGLGVASRGRRAA